MESSVLSLAVSLGLLGLFPACGQTMPNLGPNEYLMAPGTQVALDHTYSIGFAGSAECPETPSHSVQEKTCLAFCFPGAPKNTAGIECVSLPVGTRFSAPPIELKVLGTYGNAAHLWVVKANQPP